MSWAFLIAGLVVIAVGAWIALHSAKAAQLVGNPHRRGGIGFAVAAITGAAK